jgi:hypothetical protein
MPGASQAISLLLVGTGLCVYGYQASQRNDNGYGVPSSQPTSSNDTYYGGHWYHSSYHSGGYSSFSDDDSFSHSDTERGGFGEVGHAHGEGHGSGHGSGGHS